MDPDEKAGFKEETNVAANVLYWNVMGSVMSMFVFLSEGTRTPTAEEGSRGVTVRIMGVSEFSKWTRVGVMIGTAVGVGWPFIPLFLQLQNLYSVGLFLLFIFFMTIACFFVNWDAKYQITQRKYMLFWIFYSMAMPFVANAFFMLLQRRDIILNWSLFVLVAAFGLCSFSIEIVQSTYEYMIKQGVPEYGFCRKKNMSIKTIMLCQCLMAGLLVLSSLPVFPATTFSNSYQTIVTVFALVAVPLALCGRYLRDVRAWSALCVCVCVMFWLLPYLSH